MGEVGSGPRSTTTVKCPRPGHAGSKVKRDGSYGPDGHRRQRYRCVPANGDAPHRFTEPHRWLDDMDALIQGQFARRGFAGARQANMPLTTGGLEQRLRPIRDAIHPRRYALKNRERTNRLLMLIQLHANGDDSEVAYRKNIRLWLEANSGRPRGTRRSITDPLGAPSLR